MSVPDAAMDTYYELLLGEAAGPGHSRRWRRSARWRAGSWRASTARPAARQAEQHFDRLHKEHLPPEEVEEVSLSAAMISNGKVHLPALVAEHFGTSRSEARRLLEQGGIRLDGEPLGAGDARPRRRPARGGGPPGRKAPVPARGRAAE